MKFNPVVTLLVLAASVFVATPSVAAGCLKGAAVGGVGGHFVGHHAVAGAAVGCAVGHHMAAKKERQAQQNATAAQQPQPASAASH
jgi:hypothetical protein